MSLLVYIFIPPLVTQARNLAGVDYNNLVNSLEEPINDWEKWLENRGMIQTKEDPTSTSLTSDQAIEQISASQSERSHHQDLW